jgi:hypothetical protein
MTRYDQIGKAIWNEFLHAPGLDVAPSHLSVAS